METADGAWGAKCMGERVPFSNPMVLKHPPIGNQISRWYEVKSPYIPSALLGASGLEQMYSKAQLAREIIYVWEKNV